MRKHIRHKLATAILLLAVTSLHVATAYGQDTRPPQDSTTAHQRFKGTEIDGTPGEFIARLNQNGFGGTVTEDPSTKKTHITGTFAGCKVRTQLLTTPISGTVYGVISHLEHKGSFEDAYGDFSMFCDNLTAVYGNPDMKNETFENPYRRGDGYSIRALREGKAKFAALWNTPCGIVVISIVADSTNAACLMITYTDGIGDKLNRDEKTQIIRRDL